MADSPESSKDGSGHFDLLEELESIATASDTLFNSELEGPVTDHESEDDEQMEMAAQVPFVQISGACFSFFFLFLVST